jgi:hypothetical protein
MNLSRAHYARQGRAECGKGITCNRQAVNGRKEVQSTCLQISYAPCGMPARDTEGAALEAAHQRG